jgi:hypothetical protein
MNYSPNETPNENIPRILGWNAAEVIAVGSDCTLFEISV